MMERNFDTNFLKIIKLQFNISNQGLLLICDHENPSKKAKVYFITLVESGQYA